MCSHSTTFPVTTSEPSKELPCNYGMLISHFGELHFHPTLSSGQTWMTANNGIVPLEPSSSSRCYKTASGLISPCHPTWYPLTPWDGRFPPRRDSLWCPSFEWSEISISEHPGMISNPDTNIKYASQSPKNSLYQPPLASICQHTTENTLFICMALFSDLAPWTTRTDQEQQWAFCL